jgi:hypothetical protein
MANDATILLRHERGQHGAFVSQPVVSPQASLCGIRDEQTRLGS